jgi:spore germination cell wall hydrolase CwlJ-like protein
MVTAYNGKTYSGADIDLAARILYAESSTNQDERNAVASVEINRTNHRGFGGTTFGATASGYEAYTDNTPAFQRTADGYYQSLNVQDCASLRAAVETMLGTVVSGPSYATYLYFVAGTTGPGDVHGSQRFSATPFGRPSRHLNEN